MMRAAGERRTMIGREPAIVYEVACPACHVEPGMACVDSAGSARYLAHLSRCHVAASGVSA
jgi:hypothetical protein